MHLYIMNNYFIIYIFHQKIYKLTYGRGTKSFLCLDELPNKNISVWDPPEESVFKKLLEWWKSLKSSLDSPQNAIDTKVYKHIIGRLESDPSFNFEKKVFKKKLFCFAFY